MANSTGYNPAEILEFSLGGFKLDTFEIPWGDGVGSGGFEVGHDVNMAIHKFIDETGQPMKHVHMMGAYPISTKWEGELYGSTALHRNYLFDNICTQQQQIDWIFGPLKYQVAIKSYRGRIVHQNLVHYTIELEIIDDQNGAAQAIDGTAQFNQAMEQAYTQASTGVDSVDPSVFASPSIPDAHAALKSTISSLQPLQFASMANLQSLQTQLDSFTQQLQAYLAPLQSTKLSASAAMAFITLTNALNSYTMFAKNLGLITGAVTSSPVQANYQAGASLYSVAAHFYPKQDIPTVAAAIARANGLTTMFLPSAQMLVIPPVFS